MDFRKQAMLRLLLPFIITCNAAAAHDSELLPLPSQVASESKEAYLEKRQSWVAENAKINFSNKVKLTEDEEKLNVRIKGIIQRVIEQFAESNHFCPARNFFIVKSCIESSALFPIIQKMPKGGLAHIHTSTTCDAKWLVERAASDENCYIYMKDDSDVLKWKMDVFRKEKVPQGYESMRELAKNDPLFISKVVQMITLSAEDTSAENPWTKFNASLDRVGGLLYYAPIFKDYYLQAFQDIAHDNIQFVELRCGSKEFDEIYDLEGKQLSAYDVISIYRNNVQKIREKFPDFILKLIISDARQYDLSKQREGLETAFKLRSQYPDLVVGYDLVGFETTGHTTLYYLDNLLNGAQQFSKKYQTTLPYFFHDGESDWPNDDNLYDAVLLKSKRIGHGFNLFHFPLLIKKIKEHDICLEICPISNQVLGYVHDLRMHPAAGYLKQGVACVLGSDDPMLFKTSGLSYDFWEAIMAWNLDLADIKQLCMNSIIYSSLDPEEKKQAMASWEKAWAAFVHDAITDRLPL